MPKRGRHTTAAPPPTRPQSAEERLKRLEWLVEAQSLILQQDFALDHFMARVIENLTRATAATGATVDLIDGETVSIRALSPHLPQSVGYRLQLDGSLTGACLLADRTLYCADSEIDPRVDREGCRRLNMRSLACAPLHADGRQIGALRILSEHADAFTTDDLEMLELFAVALGGGVAREMAFDAMRRDAEARRRLEESLRASQAYAQQIVADAGHAIVTLSQDGQVTGWNPAAQATFGWTEAEAMGASLIDLILPDERKARFRDGLARVANGGDSKLLRQSVEMEALRKDGGRILVELRLSAASSPDGWRFTLLMQDITERRAQEEQFEIAFTNAPLGLALGGLDGRFVKVNGALCAILGYAPEELLGRAFLSVSHPDDVQASAAHMARLKAGESGPFTFEKRYLHKDGRTVWAELTLSIIRDGAGAPKNFIAQVEDLTARRDIEAKYRLMAENVTDMLVTIDLDERVTFVSPACRSIMGLEPEDLVGRSPMQDVLPEDLPPVRAVLEGMARGEPARRMRGRIRRPDNGAVRWLETTPSLIIQAGEPAGFVASVRDVTDLVAHEDALALARAEREAQAEQFEIAFSNAPIGLALTDLDGTFVKVNKSLADMLGYTVEELAGRSYQSITHPDDLLISEDAGRRLRDGENTDIPVDKCYIRKDGGTIWVKVTVSAVPNADRRPSHFIAQTENLTAQRETEAKYRLMAENVTEMLLTSDLEGRVTFVSPACRAIMGCEPEDFVGRLPGQDFHADDLPALRAMLDRVRRGEPGEPVRWRTRRLDDNAERWLETTPSLLVVAGEAIGFVAVVRDITGRVAQEQALAQARAEHAAQTELFEVAFDHAPIGKVLSDRDGRVLKINATLTAMLGYTVEDMLDRNFTDVGHPDDRDKSREMYAKLLSGELSSYQLDKR